jgi:hypothetical protein
MWEGNADTLLTAKEETLNEFVFASKMMRALRKVSVTS